MTPQPARYMNLVTDFAFKRLFGQEQNKDLLINFLNSVLEGEERIRTLEYRPGERLGIQEDDRRVVFDLLCENDRGEKILVELQNAHQQWFKDRALYYTSQLIQEQGERGPWNYRLKATYLIAILNFEIDAGSTVLHRVALHDYSTERTWSPSLRMVFLELPHFKKALRECESHFEKWLYLFRNLHKLDALPGNLAEQVFEHLFSLAEIGKFVEAERVRYLSNLTEAEAMEEALKYARMTGIQQGHAEGHALGLEDGLEQGIRRGKLGIIQGMLAKGCDWGFIRDVAGVSENDYTLLKTECEGEPQA